MLDENKPHEHHHTCGCSHHEEEHNHSHHEGAGCCGSKGHSHDVPATPDPKNSLAIVDLASGDQNFELISGFDNIEHMRAFAEAYRADSMERCRGGMKSTAEENLRNWKMFGEDVRALDESIELFGEECSAEALSKEKIPEDLRDWRSIDPRNKLKGIAPDDKAAELLKD